MALKLTVCIVQLLLLTHLNVNISTDWINGARDLFGPYPRIPDRKLLKKELEFAEEFKKFYKAPKELFIR